MFSSMIQQHLSANGQKIIVFQTHTTTNKEKKFTLIFDFIHQELTGSSGHYNNKSA